MNAFRCVTFFSKRETLINSQKCFGRCFYQYIIAPAVDIAPVIPAIEFQCFGTKRAAPVWNAFFSSFFLGSYLPQGIIIPRKYPPLEKKRCGISRFENSGSSVTVTVVTK